MSTLVYSIGFTSSSTTGNQWSWQFRLNSLFDPDFTGTGSQPTSFDQWMTLYDRYRVVACEVDVTVSNSNGTAIAIAAAPGVDAAPTLTYQAISGDRGGVLAKQHYMSFGRFKRIYLMKDVFGVDEEAMMSEINYSGTSSASAPAVAYLNIGAFTQGATDPIMIYGQLRFAVRFENAHDNNVSLSLPRAPRFTPSEALRSAVDAANASFEERKPANVRTERMSSQATPGGGVEAVLNDDYRPLPTLLPRQALPLQAPRR